VFLARRSFAPSFEATAAQVRKAFVQQPGWIDRLERDHDNVRTALGWLIDNGQIEQAQQMGTAFWQFWSIRGHLTEGLSWMARIPCRGGEPA
jgi:predicted ATPase